MQHWADYVVFVLFNLVSLGIGLYHAFTGGKQRTTEEFIMANRELKVLPTTMSIVMSFMSAILILGSPAEFFNYGAQAAIFKTACLSLGNLLAALIMVPWLYPLRLTTVYEYFGLRYDFKAVRLFAVFLGIVGSVCYMGVVIYGPAIALETATGFPMEGAVPIMAGVCMVYTALGGMKAVIWTDVFQTVVMLGGMVAALAKGWVNVFSFSRALDIAGEEGRLEWANLSPDPTERHTVWGFMIGGTPSMLLMYGLHQAAVQRYSAISTQRNAMLSLLLVIPFVLVLSILANMTAVVVFAYFSDSGCDPLASNQIGSGNQLLPLFVKENFKFNHGFSGLFMATIFSGALSSASSGLSGCAAILWQDLLKPCFPTIKDATATRLNKAFVILFGLIATGVAFLAAQMPGPILQVAAAFSGGSGGPLLGMFLISGIRRLRWVDGRVVFAGSVLGFLFNFWIIMGSMTVSGHTVPLPPISTDQCLPPLNETVIPEPVHYSGIKKLYTVSYWWYTTFGVLITFIVAIVGSLILICAGKQEKKKELPDELFIDITKYFCHKNNNNDTDRESAKDIETKEYFLKQHTSENL